MEKSFAGEIDQIRAMLKWIVERLAPMEFATGVIRKIELASEEAIVNIIRHGYRDSIGKIEIDIKMDPKSSAEIMIKDYAPPFDPLKHDGAKPDIGGLGIPLMQKCVDELHYRREGNANILTLIKKC
jgi:anti-sigma regulatory factor (Ser/Thr protein kinase)